VLDPFVGSGTTSLVAYRLARPPYGYDISVQYVADARARIQREAAACSWPRPHPDATHSGSSEMKSAATVDLELLNP
jgi:hypothetical protein